MFSSVVRDICFVIHSLVRESPGVAQLAAQLRLISTLNAAPPPGGADFPSGIHPSFGSDWIILKGNWISHQKIKNKIPDTITIKMTVLCCTETTLQERRMNFN